MFTVDTTRSRLTLSILVFFCALFIGAFFAAHAAYAQTACGNILGDGFWYATSTPITDCANPFGVTPNPTYPATLSVNGVTLVSGTTTTIVATSSQLYQIEPAITGAPFGSAIDIFRNEGSDYVYVDRALRGSLRTTLATGTYTAVFTAEGRPVMTMRSQTWYQKIWHKLVPYAWAGYFSNSTVEAFTFKVVSPAKPAGGPSVLFLPGIMSTRLNDGTGSRLWEPSGDNDIQKLYLDSNGKSVNDIQVGDVIGTFDGPLLFNVDIYKSFLDDLAEASSTGVISSYYAYPYDWRLSMPDILADGKLVAKVKELAAQSGTGKVTIVAHSNGGLVAKALVNALGDQAPDLIDQLILVAVPQVGTPQAIGTVLHGFNAGIRFRYSAARARDFAQNTPMAYQLLPLGDYRNNTGYRIDQALVTFKDGSLTQPFINKYGYAITDGSELDQFLRGVDGRAAPAYDDMYDPTIANGTLLDKAEALNQTLGASWTPPAGITVHEIAGVGEPTLAGITYKTIQKCVDVTRVDDRPVCLKYEDELSYDPNLVLDGDGTVIEPSALAISASSSAVHRWWVKLDDFNRDHHPLSTLPELGFLAVKHAGILSIAETDSLILDNLILKSNSVVPAYLYDHIPAISGDNRLIFTLHSPLSLGAVDNNGYTVGADSSEIPGATYERYGEVQVLSVPVGTDFTLKLNGESAGSFTLEAQEVHGGTVTSSTTFSAIPSTASSKAEMNFASGTLSSSSALKLDYNGDGTTDTTYTAKAGTSVSQPDVAQDPTTLEGLVMLLYENLAIVTDARVQWVYKKRIQGLELSRQHLHNQWAKHWLMWRGQEILRELNRQISLQSKDHHKEHKEDHHKVTWQRFLRSPFDRD